MADESKGMGFKGVLLGMVLIPLSFFLVYKGARREQSSEVYAAAKPIAEVLSKLESGASEPFYLTGKIEPRGRGDDFLSKSPALTLGRKVEIYTYYAKEKKTSSSSSDTRKKDKKRKKKDKSKKKKKDKYKCELGWTDENKKGPFDKVCQGKPYHTQKLKDTKVKPAIVTFKDNSGEDSFTVADTAEVSGGVPITSKAIEKHLKEDSPLVRDGKYFFEKSSCGGAQLKPETVGCHRVTFEGTMAGDEDYTAFGLTLKKGGPEAKGKGRIEGSDTVKPRVCKGAKEACLTGAAKQDTKNTWYFLVGSIVAMFLGLVLITGPLTNLIAKIPLIGGFGSGVLKFVLLIFSGVLMTAIFFLVKWWYIWLGIAVIGIVLLVVMRKK